MDRDVFEKQLNFSIRENNSFLSKKERNKIMKNCIKYFGDGTGKLNLLIVMEEFAEFQEELLKVMYGEIDSLGLLEEFVDAKIGFKVIKKVIFKTLPKDEYISRIENIEVITSDFSLDLILKEIAIIQQGVSKYLRSGDINDSLLSSYKKLKIYFDIFEEKFLTDKNKTKYARDIKYLRLEDKANTLKKQKEEN